MTDRYGIYNGSQSAHCCFAFTVVDLTKPDIIAGEHYEDENGKHYHPICECFDRESAEQIADALNAMESFA